jgi:tetratricopeptide (TPR) repeat protein
MKWCVAIVAFLLAGPAQASIPIAAQSAFVSGNFLDAAAQAETDGSAEALAFAARARIAEAIMRDGPSCVPCLTAALSLAQQAIDRDPSYAEGYVQLAIALGFRGRLMAAASAQADRMPERGRDAIDKALKLDPGNTWADASLGAWHLEIVHRAGPVLAALTYGAYRSDGLQHFRAAIARDPANLLLHYHFALSILALDADEFRQEALRALQAGYNDQRSDALTQFSRKRAQLLEALLANGTAEQIDALVRKYQGYP